MVTSIFNLMTHKKMPDTRRSDKPRPMWSQAQCRERMLVALYPWVRRRMLNTPRSCNEVDGALLCVRLTPLLPHRQSSLQSAPTSLDWDPQP